MSDFLVNLALRAAGIPTAAGPGVTAPRKEPAEFTPIDADLEEIEMESYAPKAIASPREDGGLDEYRQASASERTGAAPLVTDHPATNAEAKPAPPPSIHLDSPIPERIREIPTERREIVREVSTIAPIEVRETVREREIVREKVVEREARIEAPHPKEKTIEVHPAIEPVETLKPDPGPALRDMIREVVVEKPPQFQPPAPRLTPQTPISSTASKSEAGREPMIEAALEEERSVPPRPREITALTTPSGKHAEPPPTPTPTPILISETDGAKPRVSPTLSPAPRQAQAQESPAQAPRPAPEPELPLANTSGASKTPKPERSVEVKIGSIEIRAAAPLPAPVAPEPPAAPSQPVEGFEAYRSVRQYSAWFRG
jgi:hypothetical protein